MLSGDQQEDPSDIINRMALGARSFTLDRSDHEKEANAKYLESQANLANERCTKITLQRVAVGFLIGFIVGVALVLWILKF